MIHGYDSKTGLENLNSQRPLDSHGLFWIFRFDYHGLKGDRQTETKREREREEKRLVMSCLEEKGTTVSPRYEYQTFGLPLGVSEKPPRTFSSAATRRTKTSENGNQNKRREPGDGLHQTRMMIPCNTNMTQQT